MFDLDSLLIDIDQETLKGLEQLDVVLGVGKIDIKCPNQKVLQVIIKVWHALWEVTSPPVAAHHPISNGPIVRLLTDEPLPPKRESSIILAPLKKPSTYDN